MAHPVTRFYTSDAKPQIMTPETILQAVSAVTELHPEIIKSKTRKREVVEARQITMTLCLEFTKLSLARIGEEIGGKDHATVLHARKTIQSLIETDKKIYTKYSKAKSIVQSGKNNEVQFVCPVCGNIDLHIKVWVNQNTKIFIKPDDSPGMNTFCGKCNVYVEPVTFGNYHAKYSMEAISN